MDTRFFSSSPPFPGAKEAIRRSITLPSWASQRQRSPLLQPRVHLGLLWHAPFRSFSSSVGPARHAIRERVAAVSPPLSTCARLTRRDDVVHEAKRLSSYSSACCTDGESSESVRSIALTCLVALAWPVYHVPTLAQNTPNPVCHRLAALLPTDRVKAGRQAGRMLEHDLRCNELQCRRQLTMSSQAVVTTCSHIFCGALFPFPSGGCIRSDVWLNERAETVPPGDAVDYRSRVRRDALHRGQAVSRLRHPSRREVGRPGLSNPTNEMAVPDALGVPRDYFAPVSSADDIVYTSLNPSPAYKTIILAGLDPTIINDICGRALGFWTYQITQEATFQNLVLKDAQEVRVHSKSHRTGVRNGLTSGGCGRARRLRPRSAPAKWSRGSTPWFERPTPSLRVSVPVL